MSVKYQMMTLSISNAEVKAVILINQLVWALRENLERGEEYYLYVLIIWIWFRRGLGLEIKILWYNFLLNNNFTEDLAF